MTLEMTLNCYMYDFLEFREISQISEATTANWMKINRRRVAH